MLKRSAVTMGRSTHTYGKVDVDLSAEGEEAAKVSRNQARLFFRAQVGPTGWWWGC